MVWWLLMRWFLSLTETYCNYYIYECWQSYHIWQWIQQFCGRVPNMLQESTCWYWNQCNKLLLWIFLDSDLVFTWGLTCSSCFGFVLGLGHEGLQLPEGTASKMFTRGQRPQLQQSKLHGLAPASVVWRPFQWRKNEAEQSSLQKSGESSAPLHNIQHRVLKKR